MERAERALQNSLTRIIEDIFGRLLPHAAARIGLSSHELGRTLRISVRPLRYSDSINASVNSTHTVVTVNTALMMYYHEVVKLFVATINVGNIETRVVKNTRVSFKRVTEVCRGLMQAYLEDRILTQPGITTEELTEGQVRVCSRLVRSCETFAVAHELGHVVVAKTQGAITEYATANRAVQEFLEGIPDIAKTLKLGFVGPWTNELCADLIGLHLVCSQPETEPYNHWGHYRQWLSSGAKISRLSDRMMQEYEGRLFHGNKTLLTGTHPPDQLRANAIRRESAKFDCSGPYDFGRVFRRFSMDVLDDICGVGEK